MRFKIFREHGSLNSPPIFNAFEQGLRNLGHSVVKDNEDVGVIWSVLWNGRMQPNQKIYNHYRQQNKPIIIIEVGNLLRNKTWRICLNHINGEGLFGNDLELDINRPNSLGVELRNPKSFKKPEILIATQHQRSLQWEGMPPMDRWVLDILEKIRQFSDRKVIVRPHPRSPLRLNTNDKSIIVQRPVKLPGSYDDFDIDYGYHCVINHNSGPAVQAAINGVPVICDKTSLAYPVTSSFKDLENPKLPDRDDWFLKLTHTEWTVEEISQGIPIKRLENLIQDQIKS
jgi:hypothetical protein